MSHSSDPERLAPPDQRAHEDPSAADAGSPAEGSLETEARGRAAEGAEPPRVLLTGATGYVGSRLAPRLLKRPVRLRCLARRPEQVRFDGSESAELVAGNVLDRPSLDEALQGVDVAYYLVHLMASSADFEQRDRTAAENFAKAAAAAGVRRIVYLGGLGEEGDPKLSPHLRSRQEVGRILRSSGVETLEFRASVVVGAGSLSFELIRSLTDRLPVMICPRWLATPTQPIAVDDVLDYLLAALDVPLQGSEVLEIGGADIVTYGQLIQEYARQRHLRRWLITVPILTPYLSSLWLGLVTPTTAEIGRHLIEGLRNPTFVRDKTALQRFAIQPMGIQEAVRRAMEGESESSR